MLARLTRNPGGDAASLFFSIAFAFFRAACPCLPAACHDAASAEWLSVSEFVYN